MSLLVEVRQVTHRYGAFTALDRVDLGVAAGERVGIAGPSGSGKSTLARLLTLHDSPTLGQVLVSAIPVSSLRGAARRRARRRLQLVFQDPAPSFEHHWKVWRIVAEAAAIEGVSLPQQRDLALGLLDQVRLPRDRAERFPLELSGGERRRVAIARALAGSPDLLALDESFSGLDGLVQRDLCVLLDSIRAARRIALVTVSHDLLLLRRLADRVVILDEGRIVEDDHAQRVLSGPGSVMGRRLLAASFRSGVA